ncbi:MAG: PorT family protein [Pyrinomonadaceae bacterium]|nr:PorT family protein [Sphingobacteriaceae bacterium]
MKKFLLLSLFILSTSALLAQKRLGVKLGYHISSMQFNLEDPNESSSSLSSFHASAFLDFPLKKGFYFQPGVSLLQKGAVLKNAGAPVELNPVYIEIPLNLLKKFDMGKGNVLIGAGPYGAIGFAGSVIKSTNPDGLSPGHPIVYGTDAAKNDIKRFDYGFNMLGGYEFDRNISLVIGYGLGMANIWPPSSGSLKNRVVTFSIGITL